MLHWIRLCTLLPALSSLWLLRVRLAPVCTTQDRCRLCATLPSTLLWNQQAFLNSGHFLSVKATFAGFRCTCGTTEAWFLSTAQESFDRSHRFARSLLLRLFEVSEDGDRRGVVLSPCQGCDVRFCSAWVSRSLEFCRSDALKRCQF